MWQAVIKKDELIEKWRNYFEVPTPSIGLPRL
jgi:hypothetical protein